VINNWSIVRLLLIHNSGRKDKMSFERLKSSLEDDINSEHIDMECKGVC
jgi:hypothetical protein